GITFSGVPFNGDAAAKAALMGGHIDAIAVNVPEVVDMINEKQLRALAVEGAERSKVLPDVPTFLDNSMNVVQSSSRGFAAPAGIPAEVRDTLVATFKKLAADPEYQAELKKLNMPLDFMDSEASGHFLKDQYALWSGLWADDPWLEQK
ncbi:MAG: tripartite tricarboxylate transporter substrate binding protein, partial [Pyramidobacter sp.]|nr:tripartite tricarboxylate transporter substrate binding protein [Pyramidobacter sp.]